MNQCYYL